MNTELTQQQKQYAHGMIERLAPEKLSAVVGLLEVMLDPLDRALATAEIDDEPVTEQERRDIEASREWFEHNQGTPFEQVVAELSEVVYRQQREIDSLHLHVSQLKEKVGGDPGLVDPGQHERPPHY